MPLKVAGFSVRPLKLSTVVSTAILCVVLLVSGQAVAHFLLNLNTRIIHVEHLSKGLRVYLRLPMNKTPTQLCRLLTRIRNIVACEFEVPFLAT